MRLRIPGGTPGAAGQFPCPRSPSGRRSPGPPSGLAAPSASHRQTAGEKHCALGPPGPTAARQKKTEGGKFHF